MELVLNSKQSSTISLTPDKNSSMIKSILRKGEQSNYSSRMRSKKIQFKESMVETHLVECWKKYNTVEEGKIPMCNCITF